ncbi:hypothetical protein LJ737_15940 [Hymenobacter sp. 15J16-1T3B]|uniref:hypothetical protein n=1 Tax=Hymenobacter sp. 15J16-1T3B TaxID=2886941 RepID=UPI001D0FD772|nr:hypothetical protein [Hymenobacter sp. 15J16-1T3B]MCC3158736.1 hypothetical protein [Hymenobacter sp. 15J16-1T3B]
MKRFFLAALLLQATLASAQKSAYSVVPVTLPRELADKNNQFSGLFRRDNQLLLLSESRLQERAEAKVYALDLPAIDAQMAKKPGELSYRKYPIERLDRIKARIDSACQVYEGLEAMTLVGNEVYFTIETTTPSTYCYLIKGTLDEGRAAIVLDPAYLVPLPKPALTSNTHIHNAGFEAMVADEKGLLLLFEFNSFGHDNQGLRLPSGPLLPNDILRPVPLAPLPFRVTDMVYEGKNRYTAINFFYKGDEDAVYRPAAGDANAKLVQDGSGYKNYCRLISLEYKKGQLSWKPTFELPAEYMPYNLEGLAAYRGGYFLINDKYGPSNQSTLLYLQKQ